MQGCEHMGSVHLSSHRVNRGCFTHSPVSLQLAWQLNRHGSTNSVCSSQVRSTKQGGQEGLLTHPPVSAQLPWQLCRPAQTSPPSRPSEKRPQKPGPAPPPRQRGHPWRSAPQTWLAPAFDRGVEGQTGTITATDMIAMTMSYPQGTCHLHIMHGAQPACSTATSAA